MPDDTVFGEEKPEIVVPVVVDRQTEARWVTIAQALDSWLGSDSRRANLLRAAIAEWALVRMDPQKGELVTQWARLTAVHDGLLREHSVALIPPDRPGAWFPFDLEDTGQAMVDLMEGFEDKAQGVGLFGVN